MNSRTPIETLPFIACRCGAKQQDTTTSDGTSRTHACHACGAAVTITASPNVTLLRGDLARAWNATMFATYPR